VPGSTGDQLRDFLRQQVQAASDEAIRSGGQVSAEEVETLGRLARLVDIYQAAQPPPTRQRWPIIVVLGGTLLLVSALLFARVAETEIELELALSEVSFVLPIQQVLTETMELSTLGVSGLRKIEMPRARNREAQTLESFNGVRLSVASEGKRQGSINLASSMLPAETHVWMRRTELPHLYRLSLRGTDSELQADVNGPVQVGFSGGGIEQLDFVTPQAVIFQAGADEIDLDLAFLDLAKSRFSSQLSANDLSLVHIDEFLEKNHSLVRRVSTILSGAIYFVSLNDQERKLRPGEIIQFERSQGEFRTLRLQDNHIELKFHGRVRGLSAGLDENRRNLMPTWLEWMRARHSLSLLWGTALYLFGLIAGALRWLGRPI